MQRIKHLANPKVLVVSFLIAVLLCIVKFNEAQDTHQPIVESHETEHHSEAAHGVKKLEAGKLIMEHISDAHDWHLFGHTTIPLPVILYSQKKMSLRA